MKSVHRLLKIDFLISQPKTYAVGTQKESFWVLSLIKWGLFKFLQRKKYLKIIRGVGDWLGKERMGRLIFSLRKEWSSPFSPRGKSNWGGGGFWPVSPAHVKVFWAPKTNVWAWFLHKYLCSLKPLSNERKLWSLKSVGPDQFASFGALEANWSGLTLFSL